METIEIYTVFQFISASVKGNRQDVYQLLSQNYNYFWPRIAWLEKDCTL